MSRNLLLADDSITIQKVVGITFAGEDFSIVAVDNGEDAVRRAKELRPDIILADVVMPKRNGYEVCAAVKNDPELAHIPVLLLAGTFEAFDEQRARNAHADGHIAKPFESQALVNKVRELLERPAVPAEPRVGAAAAPAPASPELRLPLSSQPPAPVVASRPAIGLPAVTPPAPGPASAQTAVPPATRYGQASRPSSTGTPAARPAPAAMPFGAPTTPTAFPTAPPASGAAPGRSPAQPARAAPPVLSRPPASAPIPGSPPRAESPSVAPPRPPATQPVPEESFQDLWGAPERPPSSPAPAGSTPNADAIPQPRPPAGRGPGGSIDWAALGFETGGASGAKPVRSAVDQTPNPVPTPSSRAAPPTPGIAHEAPDASPGSAGTSPGPDREPIPTVPPVVGRTIPGGSAIRVPPARPPALIPPAPPAAPADALRQAPLHRDVDRSELASRAPESGLPRDPSGQAPELLPFGEPIDLTDLEVEEVEPEQPVAAASQRAVSSAAPVSAAAAGVTDAARPGSLDGSQDPAPRPVNDGGEAVLRQALSQASREVIERIAWEVIPALAETIIREQLERLVRQRGGQGQT